MRRLGEDRRDEGGDDNILRDARAGSASKSFRFVATAARRLLPFLWCLRTPNRVRET